MTIVFTGSLRRPMISTSSPTLTTPRSIRPVATVPRPSIENTSSTAIRNGLSSSRFGCGNVGVDRIQQVGDALARQPDPWDSGRPAASEPRMIGISSPGKSYLVSSSRISISTRSSSSGSSTRSILFRKTTMAGTSTWRASRTCSRVCGIGPSAAETTRIAPSIWAAPVIMFLIKSAWPGQSMWA